MLIQWSLPLFLLFCATPFILCNEPLSQQRQRQWQWLCTHYQVSNIHLEVTFDTFTVGYSEGTGESSFKEVSQRTSIPRDQ